MHLALFLSRLRGAAGSALVYRNAVVMERTFYNKFEVSKRADQRMLNSLVSLVVFQTCASKSFVYKLRLVSGLNAPGNVERMTKVLPPRSRGTRKTTDSNPQVRQL